MEIWKPIVEADGYFISNYGRVCSRRKDPSVILKAKIIPNGYVQVNLSGSTGRIYRYVHRLVAQAFLDNPDNLPQVNHIDGRKTNNRIDNLEWVSISENQSHAFAAGLKSVSEQEKLRFAQFAKNNMSKRVEQLTVDGQHVKFWDNACDVTREMGLDRANIAMACRKQVIRYGYRWRYV